MAEPGGTSQPVGGVGEKKLRDSEANHPPPPRLSFREKDRWPAPELTRIERFHNMTVDFVKHWSRVGWLFDERAVAKDGSWLSNDLSPSRSQDLIAAMAGRNFVSMSSPLLDL